jgi:hypothetical protein
VRALVSLFANVAVMEICTVALGGWCCTGRVRWYIQPSYRYSCVTKESCCLQGCTFDEPRCFGRPNITWFSLEQLIKFDCYQIPYKSSYDISWVTKIKRVSSYLGPPCVICTCFQTRQRHICWCYTPLWLKCLCTTDTLSSITGILPADDIVMFLQILLIRVSVCVF